MQTFLVYFNPPLSPLSLSLSLSLSLLPSPVCLHKLPSTSTWVQRSTNTIPQCSGEIFCRSSIKKLTKQVLREKLNILTMWMLSVVQQSLSHLPNYWIENSSQFTFTMRYYWIQYALDSFNIIPHLNISSFPPKNDNSTLLLHTHTHYLSFQFHSSWLNSSLLLEVYSAMNLHLSSGYIDLPDAWVLGYIFSKKNSNLIRNCLQTGQLSNHGKWERKSLHY